MIDHVQVACPPGGEDRERKFFGDALGWEEIPKPPALAVRGGCWFRVPGVGGPSGEIHVGIEDDFRPALKAHPAFVVDIDVTATALASAGFAVTWADSEEIPGRRRFHSRDGVGNRIEFVAAQ
ncbi:Glyoxalase [Rhodococcus sp. AW25M09]|uniref:glyoxalase n=1 Tax=Rhodococcus sp. AW25M09 TaxID=1268303 RepID=UPI0002AC97DF|nr:glyoxalase [Rhodococcus sp. AW25M09]CCQ14234.1 Glyoxalase [Rhodococcus sp. AW25M09]